MRPQLLLTQELRPSKQGIKVARRKFISAQKIHRSGALAQGIRLTLVVPLHLQRMAVRLNQGTKMWPAQSNMQL